MRDDISWLVVFTTLADFCVMWGVGTSGIGGGGEGDETFEYVRGNCKPLKEANLAVVARRHPYISPA